MIKVIDNKIYRRQDKELLVIEPWGPDSLRVRATQNHTFNKDEETSALLPALASAPEITTDGKSAVITNGKIRCELMVTGKLKFFNQKGELLLEEYDRNRFRENVEGEFNSALEISPRTFTPIMGTENFKLAVRFEPNDGEKIYGMGQYQQPYMDMKGCVVELAHRNSQASVPFALSNKGYGLLWNNPAIGSVTFGKNLTEWTALSTRQMDYWITAGDTPAEIEEAYADATGKVPMMPDYGCGFWQCKLRYQTQEELLEVAREYKRRGLPISVIVADYFHWPHQGDWKFDKDYWPDLKAMVDELEGMGIKLMVSIWPTVEEGSENFKEMEELGYLSRNDYGKGCTSWAMRPSWIPPIRMPENMCGARLKRIIMTTAYAFSGWMRRNRNSPTMNTATIVFTWAQIWKSAIFSPGNTREWPMKAWKGKARPTL